MIERDISRVRLLIADLPRDGEAGCGTGTLLTDVQVEDLLDLSGGNVKRAAPGRSAPSPLARCCYPRR